MSQDGCWSAYVAMYDRKMSLPNVCALQCHSCHIFLRWMQVDLAREARHLWQFNYNFRHSRHVTFPYPVYPLVSDEVLVETFEARPACTPLLSALAGYTWLHACDRHVEDEVCCLEQSCDFCTRGMRKWRLCKYRLSAPCCSDM